jgi:hypothetical protein
MRQSDIIVYDTMPIWRDDEIITMLIQWNLS